MCKMQASVGQINPNAAYQLRRVMDPESKMYSVIMDAREEISKSVGNDTYGTFFTYIMSRMAPFISKCFSDDPAENMLLEKEFVIPGSAIDKIFKSIEEFLPIPTNTDKEKKDLRIWERWNEVFYRIAAIAKTDRNMVNIFIQKLVNKHPDSEIRNEVTASRDDIVLSDGIPCPTCESTKTIVKVVTSRAGDEPVDIKIYCSKCAK
jgi:DNA-directed RNA polymerase subunit M/transcription elongation factor TFIIS